VDKFISVIRGLFFSYFMSYKFYNKWPLLLYSNAVIKIHNKGSIHLGRKNILSPFAELVSFSELKIGDSFFINKYSRIISKNRIVIGNNVTIAQFVTILDHDHAHSFDSKNNMILEGYNCGQIEIGNNVWIGDKVTICKNVKIGDNVIIGANSVVLKDFESNCVIGGVPAKILYKLND
jgi:acetyltransferase-like isoleucine patch superfamily enzyme